jgi:predicted O-methyltransferase YrrM
MRACAETLESETTPAELDALVTLLRTEGLKGRHLEIGTAAGGTLTELMSAYPAEARPPFVVIDPMSYFPGQLEAVRRNLDRRGIDADTVEFRVGYSPREFPRAVERGDRFAFIFIDGDHSAPGVMKDLMWTRLLDVGGYVCLHDVAAPSPDVRWAVKRFLAANPTYEVVKHVDSLLILRKIALARSPEVTGLDLMLSHPVKVLIKWRRSLHRRLGRA